MSESKTIGEKATKTIATRAAKTAITSALGVGACATPLVAVVGIGFLVKSVWSWFDD